MKYTLLIITLHSWISIFSQSPAGVNKPILWQKENIENLRSEVDVKIFNFHPYQYFDEDRGHYELPLKKGIKKLSLFVVFSSENNSEIAKVNGGSNDLTLSNEAVFSNRKIEYKNTFDKPKILKYIGNLKGKNNANTIPSILFGSKEFLENWYQGGVAEVIAFDQHLSKKEQHKIESYLSLKYGISLPDTTDYVNALGQQIWIAKNDPRFSHHVTAIGRDDGLGLYQKQSHNLYDNIDLTMGLGDIATTNIENKSEIIDGSFLFWSDNGESTEFKRLLDQNKGISSIDRQWKVTLENEEFRRKIVEIKLTKNTLSNLDSSLPIWLVLGNARDNMLTSKSKFIKMEDISMEEVICHITFDQDASGADYFTFVNASEKQINSLIQDELNPHKIVQSNIEIYPNPVLAGSEFNIIVQDNKEEAIIIEITNINGDAIKSQNILGNGHFSYKERLTFPGVYNIRIKGKNKDETHSLIVH